MTDMTKETDWFVREPKDNEILNTYTPNSTEELAEWLLIAARNVVDADGKRTISNLKPFEAYQIARMMQIAKLKVPK